MTQVYLASASPRRADILNQIGLNFTRIVAAVPEVRETALPPDALAAALARTKAEAVAAKVADGLVIGADTIVVCDGRVLGKPADLTEAAEMLRTLSGRRHEVITGLAVFKVAGRIIVDCRVDIESTMVYFRQLEEREIKAYLRTGEPLDKAGAYGIQGKGALLVQRIEGCYFNVVGLPVGLLARMLESYGVRILG